MKKNDTLLVLRSWSSFFRLLCALLFVQLVASPVKAQLQKRSYAPVQHVDSAGLLGFLLPGHIDNAINAADNSPFTASTLAVDLGVASTATQFLQFTVDNTPSGAVRTLAAGTVITVKLTLPKTTLVSLASSVQLQCFNNLTLTAGHWGATAAGSALNLGSIASLLSSAGSLELTMIAPAGGCQGVWVKLDGVVSVGLSLGLYDAYVMDNVTTSPIKCDSLIDELDGVRSNSLANLASATSSVVNPLNAIDVDTDPPTTFATMNSGALVATYIYLTPIFNTPSHPGDSIRLIVQDPGAGLIDLNVLNGFQIQPYLGQTAVGSPITNTSVLLSLRLLSGPGGLAYITAPISGSFDRVEIRMGGIATAFTGLRIYDVKRIIPKPTYSGTPSTNDTVTVYVGANVSFTATPQDLTDGITWYNPSNTIVSSSVTGANTYSINNVQLSHSGNYVAVTTRNGCSETSARDSVFLRVLDVSIIPPTLPNGNIGTPYSQDVKVTGDTLLGPFHFRITSGSLPPGLTLDSITGMITGTPTTIGTYIFTVTAVDKNNTECASKVYTIVIGAPLPIKLQNFNATKDNNGNPVLAWTTADAVNFSHFEVQRSSDGVRFTTISTVAYNGNTYTYTDESPMKGVNHYRLKMVDIDNHYENSIVRSIIVGRSGNIEIFPNPVSSIITLSTGNMLQGKVTVQVTDLSGRVLKQEQKTANAGSTISVDASKLLNGVYMLNVISDSGERVFTGRVMVRH